MPMCQSALRIYFLVVCLTTLSAIRTLIDELEGIWKEEIVA
jgi:hypothetical protein